MVSALSLGALALYVISCTASPTPKRASWPNGPFYVEDEKILDASGNSVKYAGVNWPGHGEAMVPEGLQYQSISQIVSDMASIGMNVIRLTYAIEMIDQIYENGGEDVSLETAFTTALGTTNGTAVLNKVLANNPSFTASTTRLEVFDAVAAECASKEIYIHLDNHMSKGAWCCSATDGNAWFGDQYFNVANWTRGLAYMANHGKSWSNLMSMSLRNELRQATGSGSGNAASYTWETWYSYIKQAAAAINDANADPLIFLSGLNYDTYLTPVVQGTALTPGTGVFSRDDFEGFADKLVLELHNYATTTTSCSSLKSDLYTKGFQAMNASASTTKNVFPVLMTEWGFDMSDDTWEGIYNTCLASYLPEGSAGWMLWVLVGSYYIRSGTQDYEETWGLYNHDWSAWRNQDFVEQSFAPMIAATLA